MAAFRTKRKTTRGRRGQLTGLRRVGGKEREGTHLLEELEG